MKIECSRIHQTEWLVEAVLNLSQINLLQKVERKEDL